MHISPEGLGLITKWEGYHRRLPNGSCTTYYCPAGVLTIGYGCTHGIRKGMIWTHEEALQGLRRELDDIERAVNQYVTADLTQAQYDTLVSFAYNVGTGALKKSTLLKLLNAGNYEGARRQLARWTRGGGRVLPGLVNRRRDEQAHWVKDIPIYDTSVVLPKKSDPAPDPVDAPAEPMPQQVDEPVAAKEVLKGSRKFNLILWLRTIFGLSSLGSAGFLSASTLTELKAYLDTVAAFSQAYGVYAIIVVAVLGFVASEMLARWSEEDVEDGRYTPSGEV